MKIEIWILFGICNLLFQVLSMSKGIFIVLYGVNNLGKTTQAQLLVERLNKAGVQATYLKYPIYDIEPSGVLLNVYLRKGNPFHLTPREVQVLYTLNRTQYAPQLETMLESGTTVVAEDYTGTGIAWGMGTGVEQAFLARINNHLRKEDVAILIDGDRFIESTEAGHHHESDDELLVRVRQIHQKLGQEYSWHTVKANEDKEKVHEAIWAYVTSHTN